MDQQPAKWDPDALIPCSDIQTLCLRVASLGLLIHLSENLCLHDLVIRQESPVFKVNLIQIPDELLFVQVPAFRCQIIPYRGCSIGYFFRKFHILEIPLCLEAAVKPDFPAPQLRDPLFVPFAQLSEGTYSFLLLRFLFHTCLKPLGIGLQPFHTCIQSLADLLIVRQLQLLLYRPVFFLFLFQLPPGLSRLIADLIHFSVQDFQPLLEFSQMSVDLQIKLMSGL